MSLAVDQYIAPVPGSSSRKAGQEQAKPATSSDLGRAGAAIFGEVEGSGASPYRTFADSTKVAGQTCVEPRARIW